MLALEVVPLAVTDIDRALAFYIEQAGFTLDVDYRPTSDFRVVQLTPPGVTRSHEPSGLCLNVCRWTESLGIPSRDPHIASREE